MLTVHDVIDRKKEAHEARGQRLVTNQNPVFGKHDPFFSGDPLQVLRVLTVHQILASTESILTRTYQSLDSQ